MKESDLPGVAKARLIELGKDTRWLVEQTGFSRAPTYAFLVGKAGMPWSKLEKLFDVLGLNISIEVTSNGRKVPKSTPRKVPTPPNMPL